MRSLSSITLTTPTQQTELCQSTEHAIVKRPTKYKLPRAAISFEVQLKWFFFYYSTLNRK